MQTHVVKRANGKPDLNVTIGEDFVEIQEQGAAEETTDKQFDARVNQSVIESDYSSGYEDDDFEGCINDETAGSGINT